MISIFRNFMLGACALVLFSLGCVEAQDLSKVSLRSVSYGGTGCPQGSEIASYSNGTRTVLVFSPLAAFIGPLWTAAERRENCQISLDFAYPKGLQYTLASAAFKGTVDLDRGVTATVGTVVYFSGGSAQTSSTSDFIGPLHQEWYIKQYSYPKISDYTLWSPCGEALPLNINTQVRLASTDAAKSGTIQTDGRFDFGVVWRGC